MELAGSAAIRSAVYRISVPPIDQGRLEAIQWIAFACMVIDHIGVFFLENAYWARAAGRLAFPLFALVFSWRLAETLTRSPRRGLLEMGHRLAVAGAFAQAGFWLMTDGLATANVMFTFLLTLAVIALSTAERNFFGLHWTHRTALALALLAVFHRHVDYGAPGIVLLVGLYGFFRWREMLALAIAVAALAAMTVSNPVHLALAALPIAAWLVTCNACVGLPRVIPRLFYILYPAHLFVILAWFTGRALISG